MTSVPSIANPEFNRSFFVADHAISQSNSTITNMTQLNRFEVADISNFELGDTIKISGDAFSIFNISGNQIQTSINATQLYPIGSIVTKEPITKVFINGKGTDINDLLSLVNITDCTFNLSTIAEFNVATNKITQDNSFTFANGNRSVVYTGIADLSNTYQERDWIKAEGDADSTFMRIVDIVGNTIRCDVGYSGTTGSSHNVVKRRPDYITDDSAVSINCLGRTVDGTAEGALIKTGSDVVKQLLIDIDLEDDLDVVSFDTASIDNNMRMSIVLPYEPNKQSPKVKDIINNVNQTVFGSLSLKQDLTLGYFVTSAERLDSIQVIKDDDIIKWSMTGKSTNSYQRVLGNYKFVDFDNSKLDSGNSLVDVKSDRIIDYDISNKEVDRTFRVYRQSDAQELAERFIHQTEQTLLEVKISSDIRLSNIEIGDRVRLDLIRFINQPSIGDSQRVFSVIGIKKNFNKIDITLTDLGNLYNRSAVFSSDTTPDYSASTSDDRRFNSYFTDDNGLITTYDESKDTNLIS
jgi:hypothetical protein